MSRVLTLQVRAEMLKLRNVDATYMSMQGDWTSPRGENRRDLARQDSSEELPGRRGGDGRMGGNEIPQSSGARILTPAERVQAMGVPMQTGVVSNQKDAKGLNQKQVRQFVCFLFVYWGRAASGGALAPEPPRAHWTGPEQGFLWCWFYEHCALTCSI